MNFWTLIHDRLRRALVGVACVCVATGMAVGCRKPANEGYQGYVEAEFVRVGAPVPGLLLRRMADRGATVRVGDPLFELESEAERAAVTEAERRLAQARARHENLLKGRRPSEIAALEARVAQRRASLELADRELARREKLRTESVISAGELDVARSGRDGERAALDVAMADLETARLGGREAEVQAAEAEREAAEAALVRARWSVTQKIQRAPVDGVVHDTYFEPGEFVPAGTPVLALLPPARLKVRFFVPQSDLPSLAPGREVEVTRDGTATRWTARVSYVSTRPEFTPPVIYSRSTRAKLVFLVEADLRPEDTVGVGPGQPVDVRRLTTTP